MVTLVPEVFLKSDSFLAHNPALFLDLYGFPERRFGMNRCPFHVGDTVVYQPSSRGHGLDAMASEEGRLVPGRSYRIMEIQAEDCVVVEGYHHPGGGIHWTEFKPTGPESANNEKID